MTMTGHKTRSIFERYNIVSEADLHEAAARLERFMDKDTGKDTIVFGFFGGGVLGDCVLM